MSRKRQQSKPQDKVEDVPDGKKEDQSNRDFLYYCMCLALGLQVATLIAWPIALHFRDTYNFTPLFGHDTPRDETKFLWIIPLAGLLISLGYWENFTTENSSINYLKTLSKIKKLPIVSKYAVYLYVSLWKCCIYLAMLLLIQAFAAYYHEHNISASWSMVKKMFTDFIAAFAWHKVDLIRENSEVNSMYST